VLAARAARAHVLRPVRVFGAIAMAGVVAALLAFTGLAVPRAFLAMSAAVTLGFAVNHRPIARRWRAPLRRAGWIACAAVMFAAIPSDVPRESGSVAFSIGTVELLLAAIVVLVLLAAFVRIAIGIRADPGDHVLVGVLGGLVAFVLLFPHVPPPHPAWLYPFALTAGAALARANGNLARP
jgi:hypothetical protein